MTYFNPLAGAAAQSSMAQHVQQTDKDRQLRRADALKKNSAARSDRLEHDEVESSDAITMQSEEEPLRDQGRKRKRKSPRPNTASNDDDLGGLDVRA